MAIKNGHHRRSSSQYARLCGVCFFRWGDCYDYGIIISVEWSLWFTLFIAEGQPRDCWSRIGVYSFVIFRGRGGVRGF